ncbi:MAG TPA: FUSC family protein, partial [Rhodanobacter sp.]|nr:FUSC family protein [Rhodanobacter sp.]
RETRTAARTARINAQASIDRMRTEPATPPELLALARALFANGNRLARTAMTLEALIDDISTLPAQADIRDFVELTANALQMVATALREQHALDALPDLRAQQRGLVVLMRGGEDPAAAELLARISDRLVDNVDTLAHVAGRSQAQPAPAFATQG